MTKTNGFMEFCLFKCFFKDFIFGVFAFIMIGEFSSDRKQSGQERGAGSAEVHMPGFEN